MRFVPVAGRHAIAFFGFLRHSKGEWAGQTFALAPWQAFVVGCLFGWQRADGLRRFRTAYCAVPRKNGKSTLSAGIGLYLLVADGEQGAEVYSAATTRDQARIGRVLLADGMHAGRRLLPADWLQRMRAPCAIAPFYGWLLWLNREGQLFADASRGSTFMIGAGGHYVWMEPEHDAVIVVRWLDGAHAPGFVSRVARALRDA